MDTEGVIMEVKESKRRKWTDRLIRVLIIVLIFIGVGVYIYADDYYRPSLTAEEVLAGGEGITFEETGGDLVFTPADPEGGVVIYPGGRVSERAYGYLGRKIAAMGYKTVIVRAPLKLSIFSNYAAEDYVSDEKISDWVIIGHSLGGVSASRFVKKNPDKIRGLILLAAYPDGRTDLSASTFEVFSLVGDKDLIIDYEKLNESQARLPKATYGQIIRGGNHSSFANYGTQDGDSLADIGYEEQQQFVLDAVLEAFK